METTQNLARKSAEAVEAKKIRNQKRKQRKAAKSAPLVKKNEPKKPPKKPKKPKTASTDGDAADKPRPPKPTPKPAEPVEAKSSRNFSDDLLEYLKAWNNRNAAGSNWKFSKVLQSWALDNCFRKDKIDTDVFKKLIPYISSVQGVARERLMQAACDIIEKGEKGETEEPEHSDDEAEGEGRVSKKEVKRAIKVKEALDESV